MQIDWKPAWATSEFKDTLKYMATLSQKDKRGGGKERKTNLNNLYYLVLIELYT